MRSSEEILAELFNKIERALLPLTDAASKSSSEKVVEALDAMDRGLVSAREELMANHEVKSAPNLEPKNIERVVAYVKNRAAYYCDMEEEALYDPSNKYSRGRSFTWFILRQTTKLTITELAGIFGTAGNSTVYKGIQRTQVMIENDALEARWVRQVIADVEAMIRGQHLNKPSGA